MIFGTDRHELRKAYAEAWEKHDAGATLTALERQIAAVIEQHPEYLDAVRGELERDYTPETGGTNPFLHMGLHLGLREQVASDRPAGIAAVFTQLARKTGDAHLAEHSMIECLAETLWEAQRQNAMPDEQRYLERLRRL